MKFPKEATDQIALKGVSVYYLRTTFLEECEEYLKAQKTSFNFCCFKSQKIDISTIDISTAKVYDIESLRNPTGMIRQKGRHLKDDEGKDGISYVDCLEGEDNVGAATHMISYGWGNRIVDITSALKSYCDSTGIDEKRTYIWICCLCNNQHRIKEKMVSGENVSVEEFRKTFEDKVLSINHVLALMIPWDAPIYNTRVWCIFEFFTAIMNNCNLDIILPEAEKEKLVEFITTTTGPKELLSTLAATRIEDAEASEEEDRKAILSLVENGVGFNAVNGKVNERIRIWVKETLVEAIKEAEDQSDDAETDDDLALLYNNVGLVFMNDGEYDNAIYYKKKALEIVLKVHGKESEYAAISYNNIGQVYYYKKDYDNALEYYNICLDITLKLFGDQHEDTAESYNNIAEVYTSKEDYDKAVEFHNKSLDILIKVYGEDHEATAASYNNIGAFYDELDYHKAMEYKEKSLGIKRKIFGDGHPETANSLNNIAFTYNNLNNLEKAVEYMKRAFEIYEKVFGADHPRTIGSKVDYEFYVSLMNKESSSENSNHAYIASKDRTNQSHHSDQAQQCRRISKIQIQSGAIVDGITVTYSNDSTGKVCGGKGHSGNFIVFGEDEYVVKIDLKYNIYVQRITFWTNLGRKIGPNGEGGAFFLGGTSGTEISIEAPDGYMLVGLHGRADTYLNAIGFHWAPVITDRRAKEEDVEGKEIQKVKITSVSTQLYGGGGGVAFDHGHYRNLRKRNLSKLF